MTPDAAERRYHLAMANLLCDRGFTNLAESHLSAAKDCPRGCGCAGCEGTRELFADLKRRRVQRERRAAA